MELVKMERGALRGQTLQNGAICIESWQVNQDEHVVLAMRTGAYDPYVVWYSDKDGDCRVGDYCQTIQEAMEFAKGRGAY